MIALLSRLTNALGTACTGMAAVAMPILDYSLDISGPEALNLLEDALSLWIITLRNAPDSHLEPLTLWRHWTAIMERSVEHVAACMHVAFSAVLLGGAAFVQV